MAGDEEIHIETANSLPEDTDFYKTEVLVSLNFQDKSIKSGRIANLYTPENTSLLIYQLRSKDFSHELSKNNKKTLVKVIDKNTASYQPNPIHPDEAEIQALRYLRGMLLIAENSYPASESFKKDLLISKIQNSYQAYLDKPKQSVEETRQLGEQFAIIIHQEFGYSIGKARKQVTMARDLGILLEDHPNITTITKKKRSNQFTIEQSALIKIGESYYDSEFGKSSSELQKKYWYQQIKKNSGLKDQNTWLDNFFANNLDEMRARGIPAPPSARWLPLPANNQRMRITQATVEENNDVSSENSIHINRMGITTAYGIEDSLKKNASLKKEQQRLAVAQLKEVIKNQILLQVQTYKNLYGDLANGHSFEVNYQTLLSPMRDAEAYLYGLHNDNNNIFVQMAKDAMHEVMNDAAYISEINALTHPVKVTYAHTNSAINKMSDYKVKYINIAIAQDFKDADIVRDKLNETVRMLRAFDSNTMNNPFWQLATAASMPMKDSALKEMYNHVDKAAKDPLTLELAQRAKATYQLRLLLDNQEPFSQLEVYQRNIMRAALETLCMGNQSLTLAGCKSARDRFAVYYAAVNTMQANPNAMSDWNTLLKGIKKRLEDGHTFRSMAHHNANVKVDDVHKDIALDPSIQKRITVYKPFSKKLGDPAQPSGFIKKMFFKIAARLRRTPKLILAAANENKISKLELIQKHLADAKEKLQHYSDDINNMSRDKIFNDINNCQNSLNGILHNNELESVNGVPYYSDQSKIIDYKNNKNLSNDVKTAIEAYKSEQNQPRSHSKILQGTILSQKPLTKTSELFLDTKARLNLQSFKLPDRFFSKNKKTVFASFERMKNDQFTSTFLLDPAEFKRLNYLQQLQCAFQCVENFRAANPNPEDVITITPGKHQSTELTAMIATYCEVKGYKYENNADGFIPTEKNELKAAEEMLKHRNLFSLDKLKHSTNTLQPTSALSHI